MWDFGFRVLCLGFWVQGFGFRALGPGLGFEFRVQGVGSKVAALIRSNV